MVSAGNAAYNAKDVLGETVLSQRFANLRRKVGGRQNLLLYSYRYLKRLM